MSMAMFAQIKALEEALRIANDRISDLAARVAALEAKKPLTLPNKAA
jgi:N-methylhydantoinase B/oxoprolinase/acetone carboxylase alpha subunit